MVIAVELTVNTVTVVLNFSASSLLSQNNNDVQVLQFLCNKSHTLSQNTRLHEPTLRERGGGHTNDITWSGCQITLFRLAITRSLLSLAL